MPRKPTKKGRRVIAVVWTDATSSDDDEHNDLKPCMAITYGEPVEINDEHVKLASEVFVDGQRRHNTSIPRGMVHKIFALTMPDPFPGKES